MAVALFFEHGEKLFEIGWYRECCIRGARAVSGRQIALYFAWSRLDEIAAPLGKLENRFPALFELRRLSWPRLEEFADATRFDQGIGGFLDHVQLPNFALFAELASSWTGNAVRRIERKDDAGFQPLDSALLAGVDTLIVMSFDSSATMQRPGASEIAAMRVFLDDPDHTLFVCPHHDIGSVETLPQGERRPRQEMEFHHHGDSAIPATQRFGDFAVALLEGLGLEVVNRFGLRPARNADGSPAPLEIARPLDRFGLMAGVETFNGHLHLPHFERLGESATKLDVLARQPIDLAAPGHPFVVEGHTTFDALLQARSDVFPGRLLICDTTTWSSTQGGVDSLQRFWKNVACLPRG
jgi:hypothetical protein